MIKLTIQSIRHTIFWIVVCGIVYPVMMTVFAKVCFPHEAEGSLVMRDGKIVGCEFMAQQFQTTNYFWPRPSACGYGTGGSGIAGSSGSNLGPTSGTLQTNVLNNISAFISGNNLPTNTVVPADMAYASASGLDPHISPEAARLQAARVAAARGMKVDDVKALVEKFVEPPQFGIFGEPRVNVLLLNLALDDAAKAAAGAKKSEIATPPRG
jgi:K+-transporting ATPase ATPase C chain